MNGCFKPRAHKTGATRPWWATVVAGVICVVLAGLLSAQPLRAQGAATLIADQVFVDGRGRLVATGAVEVWHGSVRLRADQVTYDRSANTLDIQGQIVLSEGPDLVILADSAQLSDSMRSGLITSARMVLNQQLQLSAERIERDQSGQSQLYQVVASSCPVCASNPNPLWEIRADRITHDETQRRLVFERAQFRFAGVPVFYTPRLNLPDPGNTRARGLLTPEFSSNSQVGVMVGLPYFIPFGDSRDLTITPSLSTQGSQSLGFRWRHAFARGGYEFGGQITRDDLTTASLRGYAYLRALFAVGDGYQLSIDMIAPSDRTYPETYDIYDDSRLAGHITLERVRRDQWIRLRAMGFYSLRATDVNDELPNGVVQAQVDHRIGLDHTTLGGTLRLQLGARAHARRSTIDGVQGRDVARAHVQIGWRRSEVLPGGIVTTAAVDARADHIRVQDDLAFATPINRTAVQGMLEFRWPFARTEASGVSHVVEPVVQLISARQRGALGPNEDHTMPELDQGSLFALSRSGAEDGRDNGSRVNAGLRWTRHDAGGYSTEAVIGRIWRNAALQGFDPTHFQPLGQTESHVLLAGRLTRAASHSMDLRVLLDPATQAVSRAETNFTWTSGQTDLTTRYLYLPASAFEDRTTTLSEWSFDVDRRFGNGWSTTLGWDYDIGTQQFAAARTGVTFRNDCLSLDLSVSRRFVSATNPTGSTSYNLRVALLGIGGGSPNPGAHSCRS